MSLVTALCLFCYAWGAVVTGVAWAFYESGRSAWVCVLVITLPALAFIYGLSAGA